jgi:hypothetical protein
MIGLAFGGYDVERNPTIFNEQLKYFFGPLASEINTSVEYLANDIPMVVYQVSETTVFGFRGWSSGSELAIQIELIAHHYAVPLILDLTPLYRTFASLLLSNSVPAVYNFGINFFSSRSLFEDFLQTAQRIYESYGFNENSSVIFTGVNVGGVLAKVLGTRMGHQGIGFVSMPGTETAFVYRYGINGKNPRFITNVLNLRGALGLQEETSGEDFAIPGPFDLLDRDSTYESFCNFAEMCGHHQQFGSYCTHAIGPEQLQLIRDYFGLVSE